jgi:hypothetical protein
VIVDHMAAMVDCNPSANVIITPPFYVENMTTLADDKHYLRNQLCPKLERLGCSLDIHQFQSVLPDTKQAAGDDCRTLHAAGRRTRSSKMKVSPTNVSCNAKLSGEGICELMVHVVQCPLTTNSIKLTNW